MSKEMIVSVNGREKKIAILTNGRVTEFYIERGEENAGVVGNVYKGRVMRVLPGMQSAFVDIGLERDAFLYVSDFFDEEEEIERIVANKNKKTSAEQAKREATDQVERDRIELEKQMDSAQERAEPLATDTADASSSDTQEDHYEQSEPSAEPIEDLEPIEIDFDHSGFERIADDEAAAPSEHAEPQFEKVTVGSFEIEGTAEAEVGSIIKDAAADASFERIADDEESAAVPKKRTRTKKAAAAETEAEGVETKPAPKKKPAGKRAAAKGKFAKPKAKKAKVDEPLEDAEASVKEPADTAEMSVRRGGRGRRRVKSKADAELAIELDEVIAEAEETASELDAHEPVIQLQTDAEPNTEPVVETKADTNGKKHQDRSRKGKGRDKQTGDGRTDNRGDNRGERRPQPLIGDLLREGQEILVQIAKEPIAKKGARITSHIALPGRYLVYMPTIDHLGVSRKIESANERNRLRGMIQRISQDPEVSTGGFIVRTAGIGVGEEDLRNDARYLVRMWADSKKGAERKKAPSLVHKDLDLVQRILRDQLADDFTAIRVDSDEEYQRTVEFINMIQPRMVNRIKLYTREQPILEYYGVQEEIDKALKPRVWLKSGGYLVINQTEALVAIDVNTGKFVGKGNARLEDTIVKTNLEAVEEIARQIRLRDLGGIIVLDLIDMEDRRNRHKVSQALQEALASDRSPTKVLSFNDFGLIIMTRKRVKQSLERTMCAPCSYCEGSGWIKSPITVCYEILAEARRLSRSVDDIRHTTLRVHPEVAAAFRGDEREVLDEIEAYLGSVDLTSDKHIHQAQFDFAFI